MKSMKFREFRELSRGVDEYRIYQFYDWEVPKYLGAFWPPTLGEELDNWEILCFRPEDHFSIYIEIKEPKETNK